MRTAIGYDEADRRRPSFDEGDRLRKAREMAGYEKIELADALGIHRESVARYESGRAKAKKPVLIAWALATGVDRDWIEYGDVRPEGFEPPTFCSVVDGPDAVVTSIFAHLLDAVDTPDEAA
jgi:transcriptional regulator with XRE-family HTH domain